MNYKKKCEKIDTKELTPERRDSKPHPLIESPEKKSEEALAKSPGSGSKKSHKYFEKSPTKKSADLHKISENNEKFTKDIVDVAGTKLPEIVSYFDFVFYFFAVKPEQEILDMLVDDRLNEIDRIKVLLNK